MNELMDYNISIQHLMNVWNNYIEEFDYNVIN